MRVVGDPDIFHVNVGFPSGILPLLIRKSGGPKYVISEHSSAYTREDGRYDKAPLHVRLITRVIFRNAEAITAPSQYLLNALENQGLTKEESVIVPNIVDVPDEPPLAPEQTGSVKALTVSSLTDRDKNLSGLVRAFAKVSNEEHRLQLHVVGGGPDREQLEHLAMDLGKLNKIVFFEGIVPPEKLHRFYLEASFFALNSNYETFSVATAEALAHGVPVIITDCGGPEEYVTPDDGVVVEKQNDEKLIQGLRFMCRNWASYDRRLIRERAERLFDADNVRKTFSELYFRVLDVSKTRS